MRCSTGKRRGPTVRHSNAVRCSTAGASVVRRADRRPATAKRTAAGRECNSSVRHARPSRRSAASRRSRVWHGRTPELWRTIRRCDKAVCRSMRCTVPRRRNTRLQSGAALGHARMRRAAAVWRAPRLWRHRTMRCAPLCDSTPRAGHAAVRCAGPTPLRGRAVIGCGVLRNAGASQRTSAAMRRRATRLNASASQGTTAAM
mmetsp:Transcript_75350/g.243702  ORF Transcript_75350/g.243702 Transcript_75350/m.243702 type:complete len:202 (+) Transcript_75350:470-1075(+)